MKTTQFSFLLSGDQIYFDFLTLTAHQKKKKKKKKRESEKLENKKLTLSANPGTVCIFQYFILRFCDERCIHCEPPSHNCHTELPCDLSEQHRCIIHSQLCSLCNTKIHFLIQILTVHWTAWKGDCSLDSLGREIVPLYNGQREERVFMVVCICMKCIGCIVRVILTWRWM